MADPSDILRDADQAIENADTLAALARKYINQQQRARRERLQAEGRCPDCMQPVTGRFKTCGLCRRRRRQLRKTP